MGGNIIEVPDLKQRNDLLVNFIYYSGIPKALVKGYWNIKYENPENLESIKKERFVLLLEHVWLPDPLIHAVMLKEITGRYACWLMKSSLPKNILGPLGGDQVGRKKDIKEGRLTQEEAREKNEYFFNKKVPYLLSIGEVIGDYIGGTRSRLEEKVKVKVNSIKNIHKAQLIRRIPTNYIVIGTHYDNVKKFRSRVILRIGKPFQTSDDGLERIMEEISKTFFKPVEFV